MREFLRDIPIIRKTRRNDRVIFHLIERSLKERKKEREIYARGNPDGMLEFPAKTKYRFAKFQWNMFIPNRLTRSTLKSSEFHRIRCPSFCHPANETSQRIIMALDLIKRTALKIPLTSLQILYKLASGIFFFCFSFSLN